MTTARTIATPMTILSTPLPSFLDSHSSNFVGSSSAAPSMRPLSSSVFMPWPSMVKKLTAPRMKGLPIHGCFFEIGSLWSQVT